MMNDFINFIMFDDLINTIFLIIYLIFIFYSFKQSLKRIPGWYCLTLGMGFLFCSRLIQILTFSDTYDVISTVRILMTVTLSTGALCGLVLIYIGCQIIYKKKDK